MPRPYVFGVMTKKSSNPDLVFQAGERSRQKSRFAEALEHYRQAQLLYEADGEADGCRDALIGSGDCLRMLGQFVQARRAYASAVQLSQMLDDKEGLAESLAGVGLSLRAQGNPGRALPYLA